MFSYNLLFFLSDVFIFSVTKAQDYNKKSRRVFSFNQILMSIQLSTTIQKQLTQYGKFKKYQD